MPHACSHPSKSVPDDEMVVVDSWDAVPPFADECEEATYWATHRLGPSLLEQLGTFDDPALPEVRR